MTLSTAAEPVPFTIDAYGVARVGGTRVPLEVIVGLYRMGNSAEAVHDQFPTVDLADIYQAIAYSIRHKDEVDTYLRVYEERARAVREKIESQPGYEPWEEFRQRLLARLEK